MHPWGRRRIKVKQYLATNTLTNIRRVVCGYVGRESVVKLERQLDRTARESQAQRQESNRALKLTLGKKEREIEKFRWA
jgi:hypothetical protein